jgi:hypothetical protein
VTSQQTQTQPKPQDMQTHNNPITIRSYCIMSTKEHRENNSFYSFISDYESELVQIWKDKIAAKISEVLMA